ncbi:UNVERIFIED_CONTAM: hypothetical protein RMT77_008929 [Armadillidium vulgare]
MPKISYMELGKAKENSDTSIVTPNGDCKQLTYSWHNINVYSTPHVNIGKGLSGTVNRMLGKKSQPRSQRHILKNVSGICRPGELLAIMGASGAGKTTLLNVLTFRNNDKVRIKGDLCINGNRVHPETVTSMSAYVQQDDMFIGTLTVREQLVFQAMLRMDKHLTYEERMIRVDEVITELGLTKCSDTKIGIPGRIKGISGGETKRLAFACEVLTNPPLLFCDEPTSGLDSFMAQNVVAVMKNMAEKGKTILSTIHQPSSEVYAMFDRVLLMAEGRVAFLGDVDAAYDFFSRIGLPCPPNYNPADFFISTLAIQPGHENSCREGLQIICEKFAESEEGKFVQKAVKDNMKSSEDQFILEERFQTEVKKSLYKASWWKQFRTLLWRSWLEISREPMIIRVRFFQVVAIAILLGIIYFHQRLDQAGVTNINGALFLLLSNMTFQNVFGVINTFCLQVPIFLREHFNGMYRTDTYFLSKTLAELPFYVFYPLVFVSITYYMVGFNQDPIKFLICCAIVTLVANTSTSFGYFISCSSKNLNMALTIASPFVIPMMLFGGFFLNKGSVPVYLSWVRYLSWFSYGNEALNINQWENIDSIACTRNETCFPNGSSILAYYNYDEGSIALNILFLILLLLFYRTLAFLALLSKTFRKRN